MDTTRIKPSLHKFPFPASKVCLGGKTKVNIALDLLITLSWSGRVAMRLKPLKEHKRKFRPHGLLNGTKYANRVRVHDASLHP